MARKGRRAGGFWSREKRVSFTVQFVDAVEATRDILLDVHTVEYVDALFKGSKKLREVKFLLDTEARSASAAACFVQMRWC